MIYTYLTETAMELAYEAYKDKYDFNGVPLVFTYYEIATNMNNEDTTVVALIYGAIKNSGFTLDDLYELNFTKDQIEAVKILNNYYNKSDSKYIEDIKNNKIARKVKIEELEHASEPTRYPNMTELDRERIARYRQIKNYLYN